MITDYSSNTSNTSNDRSEAGFGLMQFLLLFVIAGVITLVAVPLIKNTSATATEVTTVRNAHTICDLYNTARSVGVVFSSPSKAGIVQELFAGVSSPDLKDTVFQIPALSGHDLVEALRYCRYDPVMATIEFEPEGTATLDVTLVPKPAEVSAATVTLAHGREPEDKIAKPSPEQGANHARWRQFPAWSTPDPQQAQTVLDYIRGNPQMVHHGVEFGKQEWLSGRGDEGLWWPEYRSGE